MLDEESFPERSYFDGTSFYKLAEWFAALDMLLTG